MSGNDLIFKENVKLSFKKAKEHNIKIENELNELKTDLNNKLSSLNDIKNSIEEIKSFFKENKENLNELKSSSGNNGVLNNDKQQPTMINNNKQCPTITNNKQQPTTLTKPRHEFLDVLPSENSSLSPQNFNDSSQNELSQLSSLVNAQENLIQSLTSLKNKEKIKSPSLLKFNELSLSENHLQKPNKITNLQKIEKSPINESFEPLPTLTFQKKDTNLIHSDESDELSDESIEKKVQQTLTSPPISDLPQKTIEKPLNYLPPQHKIGESLSSLINNLKEELSHTLTSLTDREISLLLSIYDLEKEGLDPSYAHLAQRLRLSENTIRVVVMSLLNKNAPVVKERYFNRKVLLSLKTEFKELNLLPKLLSIRNNQQNQKTIFDI
ncbi:hypothetical protein HY498_03290 [Candidatus Woesearchaeota archaeon]|nr:hypothetical protein [Candidatus Woesearchaeota archaeon]